jgi:hypothetical protein
VPYCKTLHLTELECIPTAFLSVSLSQAGTQDLTAPPERREKAANDVQRIIDMFLADTGWHPSRIQAVAGALMYSKYNFILRGIMKGIARPQEAIRTGLGTMSIQIGNVWMRSRVTSCRRPRAPEAYATRPLVAHANRLFPSASPLPGKLGTKSRE